MISGFAARTHIFSIQRHLLPTVTYAVPKTRPSLQLRPATSLPTMSLRFLLIGIAWDQYESLAGPDKAEEMITRVKAALARDEQTFKEAGLEYQYLDYGPGESMQRLEKVLGEKEWSGVCM
jgi:hypothetical protein